MIWVKPYEDEDLWDLWNRNLRIACVFVENDVVYLSILRCNTWFTTVEEDIESAKRNAENACEA